MNFYTISPRGLEVLKKLEGFRPYAYKDSAGIWTIGYGFTKIKDQPVKPTDRITEQEAEMELKNQLTIYENCVKMGVRVPLTQNQFDALVIFTFNVGCSAFLKSTLLKYINTKKSDEEIKNEFLKWVFIRDPKTKEKIRSKGLENRRNAEINLYFNK